MSEIDYVVPVNKPLKIVQESVFDLHDLYKHIRSWLDKNGYVTFEKDYREWTREAGKYAKISLNPWRKIDDYVKFHMKVKIKLSGIKDVETKTGIMNKGEVEIKFETWIEKDYENRWENNFATRFMRSLYDHFFAVARIDKQKKELLDESYEIYNEVKAFLGMHRTKKP